MKAFRLPSTWLSLACRALQAEGALVESRGDGFEVLLPADLWPQLGLDDELIQLQLAPAPGAGSEALLRQLARSSVGPGRLAALRLPLPARVGRNLQQEAQEQLPWLGDTVARYEAPTLTPAWYWQMTYLLEIVGESVEPEPVVVILAEQTRQESPGLWPALRYQDLPWKEEPDCELAGLPELLTAAQQVAQTKASSRARELMQGHSAWLALLLQQTKNHGSALREEVSTAIVRRKLTPEEVERRTRRLEESEAALDRLRVNLLNSQALRLRLPLVGMLRLSLPVAELVAHLRRGRQERLVTCTWNTLSESWEPLLCEQCGAATRQGLGLGPEGQLRCGSCLG